MRGEWVVSPESLVYRAVLNGMISIDEANDPEWLNAAESVCERLRDYWSEGEGFGSSDFTFLLKDFIESAGGKAEFVDGRLARIRDAA